MPVHDKRGLSLLLIVVVIGAAAVTMIIGSSFLGIGEAQESFVYDRSQAAQILADGCADDALRRLRIDSGYSGGTLAFEEGSCILTVSSTGSMHEISVTSSIDIYGATTYVALSLTSTTITISSWE